MNISTPVPCRLKEKVTTTVLLALTCLLGACSTATINTPTGTKPKWVLFTSREGGFSIQMPDIPEEAIMEQPRTNGLPIKIHEFIVRPGDARELSIIYNDYPDDLPFIGLIGSSWFFDVCQKAVIQKLDGGRVIFSKNGQFGSSPTREFRFEMPEKKLFCETRIIVVGHRMYQLITVSSVEVEVSHDIEALYDSFHLITGDDEPK